MPCVTSKTLAMGLALAAAAAGQTAPALRGFAEVEPKAAHQQAAPEDQDELLKSLDSNGDGKVQLEEAAELFARLEAAPGVGEVSAEAADADAADPENATISNEETFAAVGVGGCRTCGTPLVPEHPKDLKGCGGHEYLHGDWKSEQLVHITTDADPHSHRHCTLGGHGKKYIFGLPHPYHNHHGARVFPICHSVDTAGHCKSQYERCHVEINGGSGCSAKAVINKLNSVKWVSHQ
mmetsp:Transcript_119760/g.298763  ORF Transcript_119760/g.298763 Transcript_119760/m.298763 type:complete len:236 (+) Transcript_119760:76-783(+)